MWRYFSQKRKCNLTEFESFHRTPAVTDTAQQTQTTHQQINIRQQVEDILQLVDDLVVDGQFACCHPLQVRADVQQLWVETLEAVDLVGDALRQSAHRGVLDISEQMQRRREETAFWNILYKESFKMHIRA